MVDYPFCKRKAVGSSPIVSNMKNMVNFLQVIPEGYRNVYAVWKFDRKTARTGKLLETNNDLKPLFKKYGNDKVIYGMTYIKDENQRVDTKRKRKRKITT
jgi:hypothetical protein